MFIDKISKNKRAQKLFVILTGILLGCIYGSQIKNINIVWELGDEAGYLSNAAYFSGTDWSDVAASLPYFGYGYSILLTPLFFICPTGVALIRGAIFVNVICMIGSYFLSVAVMARLCTQCNKIWIAIFAFISSLSPYLVSNTFKVLCEVFLSMWVWVIAYALLMVFEHRNYISFFLLGIAACFIFFIHTRAIVVAGTVWLILICCLVTKKITAKEFLTFCISFIIFFAALYAVKRNIIVSSMQMTAQDNRKDTNMIGPAYLVQRLRWLIADFYAYIISFCGKALYLFNATGGMIFFGLSACIKGIKESFRFEEDKKFVLFLYTGFTVFFMVMASVFNGAGAADNFCYIFYSRYYEYVISPIFILGLHEAVKGRKEVKVCIWYIIAALLSGMITLEARNTFLQLDEIHMDTARLPGFTDVILKNNDFRSFAIYAAVTVSASIVIFILLRQYSLSRVVIPMLVFYMLMQSSNACRDYIVDTANENGRMDVAVADFIRENEVSDKVPFVDTEFRWDGYYSRIQVLLKDKKLEVISEDEVDTMDQGTFYLTYLNSELGKRLENEGKLVEKGNVFGVYRNEIK